MGSRLCPACRRTFPRGTAACPDHGKILRDDPVLGTSLCGHPVTGWLGEGLYTATERKSGAPLGVRVIIPGPDLDAPGMLGELRAASALSEGVAIAPLDGGALPDGRLFYLFPWPPRAEAEPLRHVLQRAPRPLGEVIEVGLSLCRALGPAHHAGLPHGLLSGENVIVQQGAELTLGPRAALLDLGLGKRVLRGAAPVPSDDILAMGALLYQLATGTPVQAPTAFSGDDDLPPEFEAVVLRALAQRREDRHPSVAALQRDLESLLREDRRRAAAPARGSQLLPLLVAGASGVALAAMVLLILVVRPAWIGGQQPGAQAQAPTAAPSPSPRAEREPGDESSLVSASLRARALAVLADALRSPEPQERWQAAQMIGLSGDRRLRPMAEELLGDVEPRVAAHAAWALGLLGDRAAVVPLGQVSGDRQLDLEVGVSLTQLSDKRGLDLLRNVLRGKDDKQRMEAALWLGENNEPEAWRALRKMLTHAQDEDPQQHLFLLGRLCRGRDQAACQQLRERLGSSGLSGRSRLLAGVGLMQAGDPLGFQVLHTLAADPSQRLAALRALAEGGLEQDEERWLAGLVTGEGSPPPEDRAAAAEALGVAAAFGSVPQLEAALTDKPPVLRWSAAASLLRLAWLDPRQLQRRASEWAPAGLQAPKAATRAAAAAVLSSASSALAVPLLGRALGDRDADVRAAAATSLGQIGARGQGPEAAALLASLGEVLKDRDGAVRVAAVQALGRLRDQPAAQAMLRDTLERGALLERVAAAACLNERDGSQRHVLRQALSTPDVAVRLLAVREASRDQDPGQRASIYLTAMGDAADDVRLQAAVGLAALGDRRGLEALRGYGGLLLAQRLLARDALGRLKETPPALDIVAALGAAGEGQRVGAMAVTVDLLPEAALSVLRRGLRDIAPPVRLAAAAAVGSAPPAAMDRRARQQLLLPVISDPDEAVQARASALLAELLSK